MAIRLNASVAAAWDRPVTRERAPSSHPMSGQLELFRPTITALDPRTAVGPRTSVRALYRVQYGIDGPVHLVFVDRHGTYCEEHGRHCPAVADATPGEPNG